MGLDICGVKVKTSGTVVDRFKENTDAYKNMITHVPIFEAGKETLKRIFKGDNIFDAISAGGHKLLDQTVENRKSLLKAVANPPILGIINGLW